MAFYGNAAAGGVLDAVDVALDGGLDGAVLQHEVGILAEGAVHEGEVLAVAKRLLARDVAADEGQALAVPSEVFTVDFAVGDCDVLALPEGILRVEHGVLYLHVLAVLEAVVAVEEQMVDADVVGVHAEIVGVLEGTVADADAVAVPQRLLCVGEAAVLQVDALHAAEHLWCIHQTITERAVLAIPERGASRRFEVTPLGKEAATLPEDILALERAVVGFDVAAFLDARLAQMDGHTFQPCVVQGV